MNIQKQLFEMRDTKFRDFNAKLIPNISKETVIGVKTPQLRQLAKELYKSGAYKEFILSLPHHYFEENQLHAFIISQIVDFDVAIYELERFLPYVDNWATCDQLIMRAIAKNPEKILDKIDAWIISEKTYTVRFAIGLLMRYFLDERFDEKYPQKVSLIRSDEYYINMMIAWYFATALAKQYDKILSYFTDNRLSVWVHNKSIQKARESLRVTAEHKVVLKGLARKMEKFMIRQAEEKDYNEIYAVVKAAFASAEHADGNEQDLVNALRLGDAYIPELSLIYEADGKIVGHILFTKAMVQDKAVLALAPLSVLPEYQRQGIGLRLIKAGHEIARELGYTYSVVLGSERYYPKAGYVPADSYGILPPFDVPRNNFMVYKLKDNANAVHGIMKYAKEFGVI